MLEATDQIQNPDATETPVPEIPPQPAGTEIPQPNGASQDEVALTAEITQLWQVHQDCQSAIKQETQQFRSLRGELGRLLHQMKALLAKPGRGGEWSGWLREQKIPRATADRLVLRFERSLHPDGNCLTAQFTEPTGAEIQTLLDKLMPKLRESLPTPMSLYRFLDLMASSFEGLERRVTEEGILIFNPAQQAVQTKVAEFMPDDAQVEPVPAIADVLGEGDVESTGTSMAL